MCKHHDEIKIYGLGDTLHCIDKVFTVILKIKKYKRFNLDFFQNYRHSLIFSVIVKILDIPLLSTYFGYLKQGY